MKPWYKSKTILFNLAATLATAIAAGIDVLAPFVPKEAYGLIVLGVSLVNVGLRFITSQPLTTDKE